MASKMLARHKAVLKGLENRTIEAGWFESNRYPSKDGKPGRPVAAVAEFLNDGGEIEHPGGTKYISDAIVNGRYVGNRFVKKDFDGPVAGTTGPHIIHIPARPFMKLAFHNFSNNAKNIQERLLKKIFRGELPPERFLEQIGLEMEGFIVKSIKDGDWAPNAASTVRKKGFDKPLVHYGTMSQSVTSKVS